MDETDFDMLMTRHEEAPSSILALKVFGHFEASMENCCRAPFDRNKNAWPENGIMPCDLLVRPYARDACGAIILESSGSTISWTLVRRKDGCLPRLVAAS
eukprot:649415-Amphidinium_carterae.1